MFANICEMMKGLGAEYLIRIYYMYTHFYTNFLRCFMVICLSTYNGVRDTWNCYIDVGDIVMLASSDNFWMLMA